MKTYILPRTANKIIALSIFSIFCLLPTSDVQSVISSDDPPGSLLTDRVGCQTIDFDTDGDGNPILPGQIIDDSTYAALGISIEGFANFGSGFVPNELVAFDSGNPSGNDDDLGTPSQNCLDCSPSCDPILYPGESNDGSGLTNCTPLNNILIVEEDFVDANNDGLDDDPDDHGPGIIIFDFDCPINISTLSFVDDSEGDLTVEYSNGMTNSQTLDGGGDNDVFTQVFNEDDVVKATINFSGSGAVSEFNFCYVDPAIPPCDLVAPVLGPDVDLCAGTDPGPVVVTTPATGTGTITYQWQESSTDCNNAFADLTGETNPTYDPPVLTQNRSYRVIVTIDNGNQVCVEASNCITYTITNTPAVNLDPAGPFCTLDGTQTLAANPSGGMFSGVGIVDATAGIFDPSVAGVGTHTITYNFTGIGGCEGSDMVDIVVVESPDVTSITSQEPTCGDNNGEITFAFTDNPIRTNIEFSTDGGVTYPHNVADNVGTFTIIDLAPGTYDLWVRWGNDECPLDLSDITLTDQPGPTATTTGDVICLGETADISVSASGGTGVLTYLWSNGLGTNTTASPSPTATTTFSVTVTDQNGCEAIEDATVIVNPLPAVTIAPRGPFCIDDAGVTLTGTPAGGTFSGAGVSGTTFTPSTAGAGTHTITYEFTNSNGCTNSATTNIVVNPLPAVTIAPRGPFCIDDAGVTLTGTPAGGTFSGAGVSGTTFTPSTEGVGTHTVTYEFTNSNGCTNSATTNIVVNPLPAVTIAPRGPFCADDAGVTLTGTPAGGSFSGAGVSGTTFTPSTAGAGTHTVTYEFTDVNGCTNSATTDIIVNPLPTVTIAPRGPFCIDDAGVTLTGTPAGGSFSGCLLYTSPSPRDQRGSRMPSSA